MQPLISHHVRIRVWLAFACTCTFSDALHQLQPADSLIRSSRDRLSSVVLNDLIRRHAKRICRSSFVIFRDSALLLCNSMRFPVVPFHSFIIGDIVYSRRYRAEREKFSRYNGNFFNDKEKNAEANLRLRSESARRRSEQRVDGWLGGERRGATAAAERKETGRVSNGRIRIKRKIKVNAFRRLCRVARMNGSIAFVINGDFRNALLLGNSNILFHQLVSPFLAFSFSFSFFSPLVSLRLLCHRDRFCFCGCFSFSFSFFFFFCALLYETGNTRTHFRAANFSEQ